MCKICTKAEIPISKPLKVLDVFSGAGGFSLGFQMAGCEIIGAIEIDKWAAETFSYNHKRARVLVGDVTDFSDDYLLKAYPQKPDIIIGGPPCQGFSICVKRAGDPLDPRNSLYYQFLRIARIFDPSFVVMENVPHIIRAKTKSGESVVSIIQRELKALGYHVAFTILTASDYGVPQRRQRFMLIASKKKLISPFPSPTHYVDDNTGNMQQRLEFEPIELKRCPTLWDAISDLPDIEACQGEAEMPYESGPKNEFQIYCREDSNAVYNHLAMNHTKRLVERFSQMTWGQSVSDIQDERLKQRKRNGNGEITDSPYDQNNRRMHPNRLCNTITAAFYGNFVHPYKNRNFTAREGARIQSFPDWYVFCGKPTVVSRKLLEKEGRTGEAYLCQYSQIGNAVPPLMAKAIATNILNQIKKSKGEHNSMYVHGDNITQKETARGKYTDELSQRYLQEIREKYEQWKADNLAIRGPEKIISGDDQQIIEHRVALFNTYKDFIDQQHYAEHFDSRSNLHSTALEEFVYYLFRDLVRAHSDHALIGKSHAFKDIFFRNDSFANMLATPGVQIEKKDHDFVIGARINAEFACQGMTRREEASFDVPAIAIECKTYLDKTMLEGSSNAGEQLKARNPNAMYVVVAERLKLTEAVNLKKYKVDQIYVLRKQRNTDREYRYNENYVANPVYADVVMRLFSDVREYLGMDWQGTIADGLDRGYLI